jgi:hypothetical protein
VNVADAQNVGNTKQLEVIQAAIDDHEPHPTAGQIDERVRNIALLRLKAIGI